MKTQTHSNIIDLSALAVLLAAAPFASAVEVHTFGSNNDGLAGFAQSTLLDADEIWTTQAGSVQYRNQSSGTRNSSFLRTIHLDRSVGRSYRMEGVLTPTDGYADDNNRVGMYLFGDSSQVPNEDEVGAIGLIFNMDDGVTGGSPGNNDDDELTIRVGIDSAALANAPRNESTTAFSQDLFGTQITFTADIEFLDVGGTDYINVDFSLTDADGDVTTASTQVLAQEYTGNYFGFVTRARARNYPDTAENRGAPWVMDYQSFSITRLDLSVSPNTATPGSYDFTWGSKEGKVYDLVSDTVLNNPVSSWSVWEGNSEILPSGIGTNTLTAVPGGASGTRFFAIIEREPTPLLQESFDAAGPSLPAGWVASNATTVWEVGDPSLLPGLVDGNATNCVGTNVVAGDYADEVATVTMTSPSIAVPAGGGTLSFRQYIDSDAFNGDAGAVRLLDATDTEIVEGDFPVTGIDGAESGWTDQLYSLPPSAAGQSVKIVFEFSTAEDTVVYKGFYIDDVVVSED